jgi:hypothetical protein
MTDPITAVSLIGTILQLVDFGSRLVSKSTELYRSADGALKQNINVETAAKDISQLLNNKQGTTAFQTCSGPWRN